MAISRALMLDFMHADLLRMFSCSVNGMSSPYFSCAFARFAFMVASSSQCTRTGLFLIENSFSRVSPWSTSMLPVDDPMNTFTPAMSSGLIPAASSPSSTILHIASALSFVAPMWNAIFEAHRPLARAIFALSASALVVAGEVLGMSMTVVTPPATAAIDSVDISALWVSPGSLKCTCASMPPAMRCLPVRSRTSGPACLILNRRNP